MDLLCAEQKQIDLLLRWKKDCPCSLVYLLIRSITRLLASLTLLPSSSFANYFDKSNPIHIDLTIQLSQLWTSYFLPSSPSFLLPFFLPPFLLLSFSSLPPTPFFPSFLVAYQFQILLDLGGHGRGIWRTLIDLGTCTNEQWHGVSKRLTEADRS